MMLNMGPAAPPVWLGDVGVRLEPILAAHSSGANWIFLPLSRLSSARVCCLAP